MGFQNEAFSNRERLLLDTALALFRERGWEQVTVAQVAARAGVAKGTVYKHFTSKESIYARLALEFSASCLVRYKAVSGAASPLATMRTIIRLAFDLMHAHPTEVQLWLHCERPEFQHRLSEAERAEFHHLDEQYQALFHQLLDEAVSFGEMSRKPTGILYWGVDTVFLGVMARIAANGVGGRHEPMDPQQYFDHVADFILAGMLGAPSVAADANRENL